MKFNLNNFFEMQGLQNDKIGVRPCFWVLLWNTLHERTYDFVDFKKNRIGSH